MKSDRIEHPPELLIPAMDQDHYRTYHALVWQQDASAPGKRLTLLARDLEHAEAQIRSEFGENTVVSLWNDEDANASR